MEPVTLKASCCLSHEGWVRKYCEMEDVVVCVTAPCLGLWSKRVTCPSRTKISRRTTILCLTSRVLALQTLHHTFTPPQTLHTPPSITCKAKLTWLSCHMPPPPPPSPQTACPSTGSHLSPDSRSTSPGREDYSRSGSSGGGARQALF